MLINKVNPRGGEGGVIFGTSTPPCMIMKKMAK